MKIDDVLKRIREHRQPEDYPLFFSHYECMVILAELDVLRAEHDANIEARDRAKERAAKYLESIGEIRRLAVKAMCT